MRLFRKIRFSMATIMMLVATAAACSALFAKAREHIPAVGQPYLRFDAPFLFTLSIVLTAVALGALKGHTAVQMMLQTTIACLGYVSLIGLAESGMQRPLLYWFQVSFALLVTIPLLARRSVKAGMERGPRRTWWKGTCEAVLFSFFTMILILGGLLIQFIAIMAVNGFGVPVPAPNPTPVAPTPVAPTPPTPVSPIPSTTLAPPRPPRGTAPPAGRRSLTAVRHGRASTSRFRNPSVPGRPDRRPAADSESAAASAYDDVGSPLAIRSSSDPAPDPSAPGRQPHGPARRRTGGGRPGSLGAGAGSARRGELASLGAGDWLRSAPAIGFARRRGLASVGAGAAGPGLPGERTRTKACAPCTPGFARRGRPGPLGGSARRPAPLPGPPGPPESRGTPPGRGLRLAIGPGMIRLGGSTTTPIEDAASMRIIGIGTDIIECPRIGKMIEQHGELFLRRVYTEREIRYCQARKHAIEHFAGRWAAKEAILKAIGTGWTRGIAWTDLEVRNSPGGAPRVLVCGGAKEAARERGIANILISISHCRTYATAYSLAVGRDGAGPEPILEEGEGSAEE